MNISTTLIPPINYYDADIFQREKTHLFATTWQFAGFIDEVAENHSMFCADINGKSVVIKNFNGELRAFLNVCSHRFSQICTGPGKGPLRCPYHGWTYDENGVPYAIPKRKQFGDINPQELKLIPYQVATCGKFIFVKFAPGGPVLEEYLGTAADFLVTVSAALGERIDRNEMEINANWKLVVENTLEEYHVREVHPESLHTVGINAADSTISGLHSCTNLKFETRLDKQQRLSAVYADRPWQVEDYIQQLIFPNLTIASAYGTTISIQQIIPLAAESTRFISFVYATVLDSAAVNSPLIKAFNAVAVDFNRRVFAEDKVVCQYVQSGVKQAPRLQGVFCEDEKRVRAFHESYMQLMNRG